MTLDWSQCPEVTRSPKVMSGAWVFKGTRVPVATIFGNIESGVALEELPELFEGVTLSQIQAVIHFAAVRLA
jgi:uncharacterized protein (DUF433 family)